jgi:hypothetical protein
VQLCKHVSLIERPDKKALAQRSGYSLYSNTMSGFFNIPDKKNDKILGNHPEDAAFL